MKYLYIELTSKCNLSCKMCFKQHWQDIDGNMDWSLFLKIMEDVKEIPSLKLIYFGGIGEPTIYPKFLDAARIVKESGYALAFSTNGTMLNKREIEELVNLQTDVIYFSMDSLPSSAGNVSLGHISSRVVESTIKKLIETKKSKNSAKPSIGVEVVVSKENYSQLVDLARYLKTLQVDSLIISNLLPMTEEQKDDIVYDGSVDMQHVVEKLEKISTYGLYIKIPYFKLMTERRCEFDENNIAVIRWDGEVSPCYRFLHTYDEYIFERKKRVNAYSFGNVKYKKLSEIWMSEEYVKFRFVMKNYAYPSCTDCQLRNVCDFVKTSDVDCWGNAPSCADCLWARRIVFCPIPQYMFGKYF